MKQTKSAEPYVPYPDKYAMPSSKSAGQCPRDPARSNHSTAASDAIPRDDMLRGGGVIEK